MKWAVVVVLFDVWRVVAGGCRLGGVWCGSCSVLEDEGVGA